MPHSPRPFFESQDHVLTWMENIREASGRANLKRKYNHTPQFKSTPSTTPRKKLALTPASGNIMAPRDTERAPNKRQRVSDPKTPSRDFCILPGQGSGEQDQDGETPRPNAGPTYPDTLIPSGFVATILNRPIAESESSPSRSSVSNASGTRSVSPIKRTADLRMALRPTSREALKGKTARDAGGVLCEYPRLYRVSQGIEVISKSLQVLQNWIAIIACSKLNQISGAH